MRNTRLELEMGGKVRPLLFDFTFLDFLTDAIPLDELDDLVTVKPWRAIAHYALAAVKSGADFEGKKLTKEEQDLKTVTGWLQEIEPEEVHKITEGYKQAMGFTRIALLGKSAPAPAPAPAPEGENP